MSVCGAYRATTSCVRSTREQDRDPPGEEDDFGQPTTKGADWRASLSLPGGVKKLAFKKPN